MRNQQLTLKFVLRMMSVLGLNNGKSLIARTIDDANERLSGALLNAIAQDKPGKSFVLSGYSVMQPLAQLSLATEGPSHQELLNAIGLPDDRAVETVFGSKREYNLPQTKGVQLKFASKLYVQSGSELNPNFAALSKKIFESEVQEIDFSNKKHAVKIMNQWIASKTNNRIKNMVKSDNLSPSTVLVMLNAVYFKGRWKVQFDPKYSLIRDFHHSDTTTIEIDTMYRSGKMMFGYSTPLAAKILELPYEGDTASFVVILPDKIDGLLPLISKLKDPIIFGEAMSTMRLESDVQVYLPKFTIETTSDLVLYLQRVGVKGIFHADTAGLNKLMLGEKKDSLYVSDAIQRAFIEVNEEGTEATAANDIGIAVMSAPLRPISFKADHPFAYYVRFNRTTIFSGVFAGPEEGFRDLTRLTVQLK